MKSTFSRINNILYENGVPKYRFTKDKFIDFEELTEAGVNYMNKYMAMWPDRFEEIMHNTEKDEVLVFLDLETTGTNVRRHGIHQISGLIEVNGEVVEEFDFRVKPNPKAEIEDAAIAVSNTTREDLDGFPAMGIVHKQFTKMLEHYCDRFNKRDKMHLVGYNNRQFDDGFLRSWFQQNGDNYFGSWFWSDSLDVIVLASQELKSQRRGMPNFKLRTVAKKLGLDVNDDLLHDAKYDIFLTRDMYRILTGLELEL